MTSGMEQDAHSVRADWEAVGGYLTAAMQDVATDLGGEEFAGHIANLAASDEVLPNPAALEMLEASFPGSAEQVLARSSEIQHETHRRELAAIQKPRVRKYGRAILEGFASLNIFPSPIKRR
jgi:hypothetical protein